MVDVADGHRSCHCFDQIFGNAVNRFRKFGFENHADAKFIAAQTGKDAARRCGVAHPVSNFAQQLIATVMAIKVVNLFEAIKIDHQKCN